MITLTKLEDLFRDDAAIPKDTLKFDVVKDIKANGFPGVSEDKIDISFPEVDGNGILVRVVDPQAATGYLVFQDENEYNGWLKASLYEPSQDEMEAAANGSGTN